MLTNVAQKYCCQLGNFEKINSGKNCHGCYLGNFVKHLVNFFTPRSGHTDRILNKKHDASRIQNVVKIFFCHNFDSFFLVDVSRPTTMTTTKKIFFFIFLFILCPQKICLLSFLFPSHFTPILKLSQYTFSLTHFLSLSLYLMLAPQYFFLSLKLACFYLKPFLNLSFFLQHKSLYLVSTCLTFLPFIFLDLQSLNLV